MERVFVGRRGREREREGTRDRHVHIYICRERATTYAEADGKQTAKTQDTLYVCHREDRCVKCRGKHKS